MVVISASSPLNTRPTNAADLPLWLEGHLVSSSLPDLIQKMNNWQYGCNWLDGTQDIPNELFEILGDESDRILDEGLVILSREQIGLLLKNPAAIEELSGYVATCGSDYWESVRLKVNLARDNAPHSARWRRKLWTAALVPSGIVAVALFAFRPPFEREAANQGSRESQMVTAAKINVSYNQDLAGSFPDEKWSPQDKVGTLSTSDGSNPLHSGDRIHYRPNLEPYRNEQPNQMQFKWLLHIGDMVKLVDCESSPEAMPEYLELADDHSGRFEYFVIVESNIWPGIFPMDFEANPKKVPLPNLLNESNLLELQSVAATNIQRAADILKTALGRHFSDAGLNIHITRRNYVRDRRISR